MDEMVLSLAQARAVMLAAQGLLTAREQPADRQAVLQAIRQMGALQIDTIHVVARSPYFVLWGRLGDYQPAWLDELLADHQIFEYWAHAACFLPVEDYGLYRRRMLEDQHEGDYYGGWAREHADLLAAVLERIRSEGALRSADFDNPRGTPGGWWNWKDEKICLDHLFSRGDLMITRRVNFQRVYDLRERVLPGWDDRDAPGLDEVIRRQVLRSVQALGVSRAGWVADYFRLQRSRSLKIVQELAEEGALLTARVEGWDEPVYVHPAQVHLLEQAVRGELRPQRTVLLSPFDPLVWDRARCKALFDFDYTIECYLPVEKRRYGYFSLPILHHGALVGRLDAKAWRREGQFEVRALWLEPGVQPTVELAAAVAEAVRACARWHGTPQVMVRNSALDLPMD